MNSLASRASEGSAAAGGKHGPISLLLEETEGTNG